MNHSALQMSDRTSARDAGTEPPTARALIASERSEATASRAGFFVALGLLHCLTACTEPGSQPGPAAGTPSVETTSPSASTSTTTATASQPAGVAPSPAVHSSSETPASEPPPVETDGLPSPVSSEPGSPTADDSTAPTASATSDGLAPSSDVGAIDSTSSAFEGKELFILFGQSNMSGFTPMLDEPWVVDENITFMVQYDCPRLGQTKDEWLPAQPPLHGCQWATNGLGLGLGDYFGKAMAAAWAGSKIGLIPNAIPAVTIDIFMKGGPAPEGASKALPDGYTSAYTLMIDRAKEAQKLGRIRGILLNQGESDFNQGFGDEWPDKVATLVADLRADLGLTEAVPFIAGEVPPTGNYSGQNANVHKLPDMIPNCAVVTGEGTDVHDGIHYDQASVRIMGERYSEALLGLIDQ